MSIGEALNVMFTGIAVVFVVLVLLIGIVYLAGKILGGNSGKKDDGNGTKAEEKPITEVKSDSAPTITPDIEDGIGNEVAAAITAALACVLDSNGQQKSFAVRSIKRAKPTRGNAWNTAGLAESTRPF